MYGKQWKLQFKMKFLITIAFALLISLGASQRCDQGFVPSQTNVCISPDYIEGCDVYGSQTSCNTCYYNYNLQENGLCSYNPNPTQNCCLQINRKGPQGCSKCNRGLSLINYACKQIQIVGCLEKTQSGQCINCAKGFYLQTGKCSKGIKNCQTYSDSGKKMCAECEQNFSLIKNYCLKNKILGCKKQEGDFCTQCYTPFFITLGHCEIKECKSYSDFGCTSCQCGYYISKDRTCEKIEEGCIRYQKGICTDCYPPFQLHGASCILDGCKAVNGTQCTKCAPEYKLENGQCQLPNCLQGNNGKCKVCNKGFNYSNGTCIESSQKLIFG